MAGHSAEILNRDPLYMIQDARPLIHCIPSGNMSGEVVVAYYEYNWTKGRNGLDICLSAGWICYIKNNISVYYNI